MTRDAERRGRRPRGRLVLIALACCAMAASVGWAQPYAADGGFDRPRLGDGLTRGSVAVAGDGARAWAIVGDVRGVRLLALTPGVEPALEHATWLARDQVARGVMAADAWAASADAGPVFGWFERDATTGAYRYWWTWQGSTSLLRETPQPLGVALTVGDAGPEAWFAVPSAAGGRLERQRWGGDGAQVMATSARSLAAPTLAWHEGGTLHVAYLEGSTVESPLGTSSEWSAVQATVEGDALREVARHDGALGPPAQLALHAGTPATIAWQRSDGTLLVTSGAAAPVAVGSGRPTSVDASHVVWTQGATVFERRLPLVDGAPATPLAWSPATIEAAATTDAGGTRFLVWIGTGAGGGRLFASDDAAPFRPTLTDHVAAWFGWSPWSFGEELAGQATGAVLVGVLGTMVLLPLVWLASLPLARRIGERRARLAGAALAVAIIAALGVAVVARAAATGNDASELLGGGWGFALALALGLALPGALLARADLEVQGALLVSGGIAAFVSLTVMAFVAFQPWLRLLGV